MKQTTLSFVAFALMLGDCKSKPSVTDAPDGAVSQTTAVVYTIPAGSKISIATAKAETVPADQEINVTGRIDFDQDKVTRVFSLVNGVIKSITVSQGDHVHKGQLLAEVSSPDLANAISDYRKSSAQMHLAEKNLERTKSLLEAKVASQRDLQQAESDFEQAKTENERTFHSLEILGGSATATSALYQLRSPIDGVVVERIAQPGSQVRNDGVQNAFTIGSTSKLWVTLDLYPDQLKHVAKGDSVEIKAAGMDETPFTSTLSNISSVVDPNSFTTKARCDIPNASGGLKPMLFVTATVRHKDGRGLFVPAKAVFFEGNGKHYAFVKKSPTSFEKREVMLGRTLTDRVEILDGIREGEEVASDQALFLNEEVMSAAKS